MVQEPIIPLKGFDREASAREVARRLAAQTKQGQFDPGQQREAAGRLAGEGGRPFREEVITDKRLRRGMEQVRRGELEGLKQVFREATDREQATLMKSALRLIEQSGEDPQRVYRTVARVGQIYEGQVEGKNSRDALARTEDDRMLATTPESLRRVQVQGRVQFTVHRGRNGLLRPGIRFPP